MNLRFLSKIIGTVLCAAAVCMLPSLLLSLAEQDGFTPRLSDFHRAGAAVGYPLAAALWRQTIACIYGRLRHCGRLLAMLVLFLRAPLLAGRALPNFADALFETASGLTTTGASVIRDVEALPKSIFYSGAA